MNQTPILSIIVPSYNMEKYLPKCLGSLIVVPELMEQLEVIVVNDGSKDRTSEIAHEFKAKWPQTFRVIDKENGNYGSCINAALPVLCGKYVKVLDADDSFETTAFARLLEYLLGLEKENVDLVLTDFVVVNENDVVTGRTELPFPSEVVFPIDNFVLSTTMVLMQSYTYNVDILRKLNYRQLCGVSYTDTEWAFLPLVAVKHCVRYPHVIYRYLRGREGQTMKGRTFADHWDMLGKVVIDMVRQYRVSRHFASNTVAEALDGKLRGMVEMIYRGALFSVHGYTARIDLGGFDRRLLDADSSIYDSMNQVRYCKRIPYQFIDSWRNKRFGAISMRVICRLYSCIASYCAGFHRVFRKFVERASKSGKFETAEKKVV